MLFTSTSVLEEIETIISCQRPLAIFVDLEIYIFQILELGKLLEQKNVKHIF